MAKFSVIYYIVLTLISYSANGYMTESPQIFNLAAPRKGQLELIWHKDIKYCEINISYEIFYQEKNSLKPYKKFNETCQNSMEKNIIYDLKPNKEYEVKVGYLFNNTRKYSTAFATTLPDIPKMSPEANDGCYLVERLDTNLSHISIFWKNISDDAKNGPEFRYVVEFLGEIKEVEHPPAVFILYNNSFFNASITAKNSAGFSSSSIFISSEGQSLDKHLDNFFHVYTSATHVMVNWNHSRCEQNLITKVDIKLCEITNSSNCSELSSPAYDVTISYEFEKLYPYKEYLFDVSILLYNGHKLNFSRIITTLPSTPDKPVQNLQVVFLNESMITIKWDPPSRLSGQFHAYTVKHHDKTMVNPHYNFIRTNQFSTNVVGYMNYTFIVDVCVVNIFECSPPADISVTTPIAAPTEVQSSLQINVLSVPKVNQVTLFWKPPKVPNGPIDHYRVQYFWNANGKSYHIQRIIKTRSINLTVECIASKIIEYSFKVAAVNIVNNTFLIGESNEADVKYADLCEEVIHLHAMWIIIIILISGMGLGLFLYISYSYYKKCCKCEYSLNVILPEEIEENVYNFYSESSEQRNVLSKCCLFCCKVCKSTSKKDGRQKGQVSKGINKDETNNLKLSNSLGYADIKQNGNFRPKLYSNDSGFDGSIYSNDCRSSIISIQRNESCGNNNRNLKDVEKFMKYIIEEQIIDTENKQTEYQNSSEMLDNTRYYSPILQFDNTICYKKSKDLIHQQYEPESSYDGVHKEIRGPILLLNTQHCNPQLESVDSMDKVKNKSVIQANDQNESNKTTKNKDSGDIIVSNLPKNLENGPMDIITNNSLEKSTPLDKSQKDAENSPPTDIVCIDYSYPYLENNTEILSGYSNVEDSLVKTELTSLLNNTLERIPEILPGYSRIENPSLEPEINTSLSEPSESSCLLESELNCSLNNAPERITDILPGYSRVQGFVLEPQENSSLSDSAERIIDIFPGYSMIGDPTLESEVNSSLNNPPEEITDILPNSRIVDVSLESQINDSLSELPERITNILPVYSRIESYSLDSEVNSSLSDPLERIMDILPGYS